MRRYVPAESDQCPFHVQCVRDNQNDGRNQKEDYEISDAVTSLGNMFRYSMQWTTGMVELKTEINHIRNYLDLMNLRQDYEIYLSLNIPEELMKIQDTQNVSTAYCGKFRISRN